MKTNLLSSFFKNYFLFFAASSALALAGCNNGGGGGGSAPAASPYTWSNGVCMGPGGVQANPQLCQTANNGYTWNGTQCMGPGNVPAAPQFCQNQQQCNPVGYQNGGYQNNGYQNGGYQNGYNSGYPNGYNNGYNNGYGSQLPSNNTYCPPTAGGGQYQQCYGQYYFSSQMIYCSGQNCRGYTMTEATSGRQVVCQ